MRLESVEDVKSLVGKIDKSSMGQNASKDKPKKVVKKTVKKAEPWEMKGGNILE